MAELEAEPYLSGQLSTRLQAARDAVAQATADASSFHQKLASALEIEVPDEQLKTLKELEAQCQVAGRRRYDADPAIAKLMAAARATIEKLEELVAAQLHIMQLDGPKFAELKQMSAPPDIVRNVVFCTFALLGSHCKDWKQAQREMLKLGRDSMKQRVRKLRPEAVSADSLRHAKRFAKGLRLQDVQQASVAAAALHAWATTILAQA